MDLLAIPYLTLGRVPEINQKINSQDRAANQMISEPQDDNRTISDVNPSTESKYCPPWLSESLPAGDASDL
jgi:hypothetical protein